MTPLSLQIRPSLCSAPSDKMTKRKPGAANSVVPLISVQSDNEENTRVELRKEPGGRSCSLCCGASAE